MKLTKYTLIFVLSVFLFNCNSDKKKGAYAEDLNNVNTPKSIEVKPINHGTLVLKSEDYNFYIDPVGGADKFYGLGKPDFVLITDIHGDHLNIDTLKDLNLSETTLIAPKAVADRLPSDIANTIVVLNNGDNFEIDNLKIEAIPMYNLREEALKFHPKGRGNGYVINVDDKRIYISGDTEDIPEMRNLKDIDMAFVCMNLPYTMTEKSAASAVLDFKPKKVYPYHYRGKDGLSDIEAFKNEVSAKNSDIKVMLLNWYN
ncbi:L-ascorbate metabolism protein UlaG (beta-lactamase superfamily) [Winogradskyella wandonensis]|uniref:L-ascorbate metabolism protein UlaG (Beta-lactamase superfamily) n=1 Tax=Winogradskyella wandonensis TaxID=1442586 RepID=A0A4R1KVI6_9FLAO|nr:MBL fold metallo-hydrolase [Winogradskyella wandonensis]TCK69178.1 L-ascorbate metabolism protein UlaG (beta-lactamase superfamily) [Winogradskyella wandonensis]